MTTQAERVAQAIVGAGLTEQAAAKAIGKSANYFQRGDVRLSVEVAEALHALTGYRAAWLVWGELPMKADHTAAETHRAAVREGLDLAVRVVQEAASRLEVPRTAAHDKVEQLVGEVTGERRQPGDRRRPSG